MLTLRYALIFIALLTIIIMETFLITMICIAVDKIVLGTTDRMVATRIARKQTKETKQERIALNNLWFSGLIVKALTYIIGGVILLGILLLIF